MLEQLRAVVGDDHVLTDEHVMAAFTTDWTGRFGGPASCVVRPSSTEQVAEVLRICSAAGVPVIPQGGNTGLVGGGVPGPSVNQLPVVLSTTRMKWVGEVDGVAGQVSAGAGATLGAVQDAARSAGWLYGVDLAARDTATIGGTVATNAGGTRVLAYGMTRAQLVGIEAVLADGTVVSHMSGLAKDNTGLDLAALLCGSEGTLAVITAVRVALHPQVTSSTVALIGVNSYREALDLMRASVTPGHRLIAAEIMDATGMELVQSAAGLSAPFLRVYPHVLLLEVADDGAAAGFDFDDNVDVVIGLDATEKARLWKYREAQADAFATLGVLHKLDVAVPLVNLQEFADDVTGLLGDTSSVEVFGIFGHVGDGNLHIEFTGPAADDERIDADILKLVQRWGGSISAEHGIGRHKAGFLDLSRSRAEIATMTAIKQALDPAGILNPGSLLL